MDGPARRRKAAAFKQGNSAKKKSSKPRFVGARKISAAVTTSGINDQKGYDQGVNLNFNLSSASGKNNRPFPEEQHTGKKLAVEFGNGNVLGA